MSLISGFISKPDFISKDGAVQLFCGDALEILPSLEREFVRLCVTDPPYPVISGGSASGFGGFGESVLSKNDGKIFEHNSVTPAEYLPLIYRCLKQSSDLYVMTNNLTLRELLNAAYDVQDTNSGVKQALRLHNVLQWDKVAATFNQWYMKNTELTCYFYKGLAVPINDMSSKQTFRCPNPKNKLHPTEKPVPLFEHYILNSSDRGDVVLDPFFGSGTAAIAAMNTGRQFFGIEKDANYFEVAVRRVESFKQGALGLFY